MSFIVATLNVLMSGMNFSTVRRRMISLVNKSVDTIEPFRYAPPRPISERNGDEQTEQNRGFLELLEKDSDELLSGLRKALASKVPIESRAQLHYIPKGIGTHSGHI